ncbi:MAG: efflux RND transporter periplasmic adaptor subunit [Pseudomonadota bacterium]
MAGRLLVTVAVVAVSVGVVVEGRGFLADRAEARAAPGPAEAMPVQVARIEMQDHHMVTRRFSGQFEARQETQLSFELSGTIAEIVVREGDSVDAGDVIARLDTRLLEAERQRLSASRDSMVAQVELARRTNARQAELRERGFATDQTVDDTSLTLTRLQAGIAEIDAALSAVEINLEKSTLRAPFAGTVATRTLDAGAVAAPGLAIAQLVETAPPRFHAGLDPDAAARLSDGDPVEIRVGRDILAARLTGLAPSLDAVTRSRMAHFDLTDDMAPPDGATGEVVLQKRVSQRGAWVPISALRQGPRATWTLLTVKDGDAAIEAAEIIHLETGRAFIRGTFTDGTAYIPNGTHRVVPGQAVTPSEVVAWAR